MSFFACGFSDGQEAVAWGVGFARGKRRRLMKKRFRERVIRPNEALRVGFTPRLAWRSR